MAVIALLKRHRREEGARQCRHDRGRSRRQGRTRLDHDELSRGHGDYRQGWERQSLTFTAAKDGLRGGSCLSTLRFRRWVLRPPDTSPETGPDRESRVQAIHASHACGPLSTAGRTRPNITRNSAKSRPGCQPAGWLEFLFPIWPRPWLPSSNQSLHAGLHERTTARAYHCALPPFVSCGRRSVGGRSGRCWSV